MHAEWRYAPKIAAGLLLIAIAGCSTAIDRVDRTQFTPVGDTDFLFVARTDFVYPPGTDTAAEATRLGWLAGDLARNGMCDGGFVILERSPLRGHVGLVGYPSYEILYRGRCA